MWGKTIERETAGFAARPESSQLPDPQLPVRSLPPTPKISASLGKTVRVIGEIHSDEELYFDGELEGSLDVSARLTVGPNAKIKASVRAKELVVRGSIQGSVEAVERIVIMTGASIIGDVKTAGIVIDDGAFFKGGIDIIRTDTKPETVPTAPVAVKSHGAGA